MSDDCGKCNEDWKDFNCHEGCNSKGCLQMAGDNCKTAPNACFVCPCKYAWYGTLHCFHCLSEINRGDKPKTYADMRHEVYMATHDEICEDNTVCGCLCCPLCLSVAALSFVGLITTWIGSTVCCFVACCCKYCEACKKDNAVGHSGGDHSVGDHSGLELENYSDNGSVYPADTW